jgi:hypothetical protein
MSKHALSMSLIFITLAGAGAWAAARRSARATRTGPAILAERAAGTCWSKTLAEIRAQGPCKVKIVARSRKGSELTTSGWLDADDGLARFEMPKRAAKVLLEVDPSECKEHGAISYEIKEQACQASAGDDDDDEGAGGGDEGAGGGDEGAGSGAGDGT